MAGDGHEIAVVGMACVFPGAPDLASYWANIRNGVDAITEVPSSRWDPVFYDPSARSLDRLYCRRGGFIDSHARFDALRFGVMPVAAAAYEPDQLLALQAASDALSDAGYEHRPFRRERTGVIIGRGNYSGTAITRLQQQVRTSEQLVRCLQSLLPELGEEQLDTVRREFQDQFTHASPDSAIGLVPNLTASRIANRLDLHGPAYTLDAACASSLVAIDLACRDLAAGRCDLVLAGGVHLSHDVAFWSVFCQLGALSRNQRIRPFDERADGTLIGEGLGIVVLKRLCDAAADDDRVYAVVRSSAVSSDGQDRSLMTPSVAGQVAALESAWRQSGRDPRCVGLVEAHGAGTPAGDRAELETLARVFGAGAAHKNGGAPLLGSVKSMIGHAMPAAGMAGFIKAALSVYHAVRPPTLHCEQPNPMLAATRFRLAERLESWEEAERIAGVNAFGFGGINAHIVLGSHRAEAGPRGNPIREAGRAEEETSVLALAAGSPSELLRLLDSGDAGAANGPCRLAMVDPTEERVGIARTVMTTGNAHRDRHAIWFSPAGLLSSGGKLAFVFPGVESNARPRVDDVASAFGLAPMPEHSNAGGLEARGFRSFFAGRILHQALLALDVKPGVIAGHSIGEWTAMVASGMVSEDACQDLLNSLEPGGLEVPPAVFLAVGCGVATALSAIAGLPDISISHDNCPHQVILCGSPASADRAVERFRERKILCQTLPFRSGFHSPLFAGYVAPHRRRLEELPLRQPQTPLWSATIAAAFPADLDAARQLVAEHLVKPIRFRETVERLYDQGVRVFVQMGDGSITGSVRDTLGARPHLAISAASSRRSGLAQLRHVMAALFAEGLDIDPFRVPGTTRVRQRRGMLLPLGVPLVHLDNRLDVRSANTTRHEAPAALPNPSGDPVIEACNATFAEVMEAQRVVLAALHGSRTRQNAAAPGQARSYRRLSVETFPELLDHSFFRQAPGWQDLSDLYPVVPLTMCISLMIEAARGLAPEGVAVEVSRVRAYRWCSVVPAVDATISAARNGNSVHVRIDDASGRQFNEGVVTVKPFYGTAPAGARYKLRNERPSPVSAAALYRDRWMFHGPAYQGVKSIDAIGDDGIRGTIVKTAGMGSLLDSAGQLFGYWVMASVEENKLALPITLERLTLFGPEPAEGVPVECIVAVPRAGKSNVRANMTLACGGRVWAEIEGWTDQRFQTDDRLWSVILFPDRNTISEIRPGPYALMSRTFENAPSRDYFSRRYLAASERDAYDRLDEDARDGWLRGRIAAKDCIRDLLWKHGHGAIFPAEVQIAGEPGGLCRVSACPVEDVRVAIAHARGIVAAIASVGLPVGIRLESTEQRLAGIEDRYRVVWTRGEEHG